jgi:hypothetical protein
VGLSRLLGGLAARAPVPVFAVVGAGAREAVQDLRLHERVVLVDTPAAADVLLVAGAVPGALADPVAQVHDGMSHPRCTVWWRLGGAVLPLDVPDPVVVEGDDPAAVARALAQSGERMLVRERATEPSLLPDVEPVRWRGVGPYGQGGTGMTGGVPYGRPMAAVAPDRDGLRLDQLPLRIGPTFARFPPGLVLDVKLQGDVVQEAEVADSPDAGADAPVSPPPVGPTLRPFLRALTEPVPVAALELARARSHLRWMADALAGHQLSALGLRVLRLAQQVEVGDGDAVTRLARSLRRSQVLGWATTGVGLLDAGDLAGRDAGPVARASGLVEDHRADDPAYRALGFEPVAASGARGPAGDARARWEQRLAEVAQALDLAARAGDRRSEPSGRVESPRGRLEVGTSATARVLPLVPRLVEGLEWGDAVAAVTSLDLDLEEAAAADLGDGAVAR